MSKPFVFEKPLGMRDILPEMVEKKTLIMRTIQQELKRWGYLQIETPTLEYYDTVGGVSSTMEQRLFKLLDHSGRSLVLRPDMTTPIARVVGSLLKEQPFPIRLSYQGHVFRAQQNEAGRNAEFPEVGIELIGEQAPDADAEVITLAVASLLAVNVTSFTLAIGHIGFMNALFNDYVQDEEQKNILRSYLHAKNYVGYRHYVEQLPIELKQQEGLLALLDLRGGAEQFEKAKTWAISERSVQAIKEIEELWSLLVCHGVSNYVMIDFSLIKDMDYYTGIIFEGYSNQLGFPICNGGRYDHLLAQFGRSAPAIGFALKIDRIIEISPFTNELQPERLLITYTEQERARAFTLARRYREEGSIVTLHRLQQVDTAIHFRADQFDRWVRLEQEGEQE